MIINVLLEQQLLTQKYWLTDNTTHIFNYHENTLKHFVIIIYGVCEQLTHFHLIAQHLFSEP